MKDGLSAIWLILILVGFVLRLVNKGGKGTKPKSGQSTRPAAQTRSASAQPVRASSAQSARASSTPSVKPHSGRGKDCEYGDVNHKYSHDQQRRLQQLDSFLKNGLIDKEEYRVLYDKYTKGD